MRRMLSCAIGMLLIAGGAAAQAPAAQGHWEGSIEVPGQSLAIVVDLGQKDGAWKGTISIPAQHVTALPLGDIDVKDAAVSFAMKSVPGVPSFRGTVAAETQTMSGDFSQAGATLPFSLTRKGEPQFAAAPVSTKVSANAEGSWEGTLDVGSQQLRLVVKLSNTDSGAQGVVISLDQGGAEIPITQIVQDGAKLTLSVGSIGAHYDGEVGADKIDGRWMQGAQS